MHIPVIIAGIVLGKKAGAELGFVFGLTSLKDLPELPRYKLDSNKQIVIDDIVNGELPEDTAELEIPSKNEEIETSKKS